MLNNIDVTGPEKPTCKFCPNFEDLKCNNFPSAIGVVSKMSSYMQKEFIKINRLSETHTAQEIDPII